MKMGYIRFILALCVVIDHIGSIYGYKMLPGILAVKSFFIISGFYMSLVLHEKYINIPHWRLIFYINRYLRLAPLYLLILILTLLCAIIFNRTRYFTLPELYYLVQHMELYELLLLVVANLSMIGQDLTFLFKFDENIFGFSFTLNYINAIIPAYRFLLIPQGWSLSIEIFFYLIAPFILLRRAVATTLLLLASCLAHIMPLYFDLPFTPWTDRLFPTVIVYFLFGHISYKLYLTIKRQKFTYYSAYISLVLISLICFFYSFINIHELIKNNAFLVIIIISLPLVFHATKNSKYDILIASTSYPIYVSHIFIISFWGGIISVFSVHTEHDNLIMLILTLLFSAFLATCVEKKIDHFRQQFYRKYASCLLTNV